MNTNTLMEQLGVSTLAGAYLSGADLRSANLQYANLRGADLRNANLRGANLRGAYLQCANLRYADLSGAKLEGANLKGVDLRDAYLQCANLRYADLSGAKLCWQSHELLGEILQRSASTLDQRSVAGIVSTSLDWCWEDFVREFSEDQKAWAKSILMPLVQEGDRAPKELTL